MILGELTTQRDALLVARFRGIRTIEIEGKRVTYATDAEMAVAITDLERRINSPPGRPNFLSYVACRPLHTRTTSEHHRRSRWPARRLFFPEGSIGTGSRRQSAEVLPWSSSIRRRRTPPRPRQV